MKLLICGFGSRGDVQPALALAVGAQSRGHSVRVAVPPDFEARAIALGLDAVAVGLNYTQFIRESRGKVAVGMRRLRHEVAVQLEGLRDDAARAEMLVAVSVCGVGASLAERFGIPYRFVAVSPALLPSREHASVLCPWRRLPRWLNAPSFWVADRLFNLIYNKAFNAARASLGLYPVRNIWPATLGSHVLLGVDPLLVPYALDTPARRVFATGPLVIEDTRALPPEVQAFLDAGPAPIFAGFGSMFDSAPARTTAALVQASRALGRRLLIGAGAAALHAQPSEDVLTVGDVAHAALFPRCAAIVHHGGSGTTHTALAAGVPQLIVPHLLDQYDFAARLRTVGVAVGPLSRRRLRTRSLQRALDATLRPSLRARAVEVAQQVQRDGVARALLHLEATRAPT